MMCLRPHYGRYLLWWCAVWFLVTLLTQIPECYERSKSLAPWRHTTIPGELVGFAFSRLLIGVPFALLWGSLSWLLLWGTLAILNWCVKRNGLQNYNKSTRGIVVVVVLLAAIAETVALGAPLANWNTNTANVSLAIEDSPAITISDRSIGIESDGILLVFPLSFLVAGFAASRCQQI